MICVGVLAINTHDQDTRNVLLSFDLPDSPKLFDETLHFPQDFAYPPLFH